MSTDGDPRPPESVLTRHSRRRRVPLRLQERLRKTSPRERDVSIISEVRVPGDNGSRGCVRRWKIRSSFRGAPLGASPESITTMFVGVRRSEPQSHFYHPFNFCCVVWIPGSCVKNARPGMTAECVEALHAHHLMISSKPAAGEEVDVAGAGEIADFTSPRSHGER